MQRPGDPADPPVDPWAAPAPYGPEPGRYDAPAETPAHPAPARYAAPGPAPDQSGPHLASGDAPGPYAAPGQYAPEYADPRGYPDPGSGPGPYPAAGPAAGQAAGPYPGSGGFPYPPAEPPPRLWPPTRGELRTAVTAVLALTAAGAVLAVAWVQLAPRLAFRVDQPGRALPVVPAAEEYVAADGRFVLLTLAAGVLAGLACWLVRRSRGPLVLLALAAGGLLGAVVTWQLGLRLGTGYRPEDLQEVGRIVYQPLTLRAKAALVVEPVAAVLSYLLAVGFSSRNDLGRPEEVSSGSG